MTTSIWEDLQSITLTANAKAVGWTAGVNLASLVGQVARQAMDLKHLLTEIIKIHPSTGADAANYTALQNILDRLTE